ncbi:MAG: AGE family epimerase/isomerase [Actinomycetota bacterium]
MATSAVARLRLDDPDHHRWLQSLTDELFTFYEAAADWFEGGFLWLDDDGHPSAGPKQLLITSRMTYCFALGHLTGRPDCADTVAHGLAALRTIFRDEQHGGWWEPGSATSWPKQTYQHAFVVLASATARIAGLDAADVLTEALAIYDGHLYDPVDEMPVEAFNRAWTASEDYRGVNATMHTVEALLAAAASTGDEKWRRRASGMARRVAGFAAAADWRIPEHFSADWQPLPDYHADRPEDQFRPYGVTPGHAFEWARLLVQLDEPWAAQSAAELFDRAVTDGWDADRGGLVYTTDWRGRPLVAKRLHWPLTEAIGAACYLHRVTGQRQFAQWYQSFWEYAEQRFIDSERGGWIHELSPDGRPSHQIWAGKPDMFHALQATYYARAPIASSLAAALATSGG